MYKTFNQMPIWEKAMGISVKIFELTEGLPRKEDWGLTSQIRRASNSIGANIAEGFGRKHTKEKIKFYIYARGSANETIHHLIYGLNVGYFAKKSVDDMIEELNDLVYQINKIIKVLNNNF